LFDEERFSGLVTLIRGVGEVVAAILVAVVRVEREWEE
jgi:hypothetical protein